MTCSLTQHTCAPLSHSTSFIGHQPNFQPIFSSLTRSLTLPDPARPGLTLTDHSCLCPPLLIYHIFHIPCLLFVSFSRPDDDLVKIETSPLICLRPTINLQGPVLIFKGPINPL